MPRDEQKKQTEIKAKAKELVRAIFVEDFHQKVSQKTINEVAAQITKSLPKKVA
ncbi:MAG: hypothetical protein KGL39_57195 [Patescibacteria group bacterium]|nr:hypothetical protein [Patescibacteria group bacterium]